MSRFTDAIDTIDRDSGKKGTGLSYKSTGNKMYDSLYNANPYVGLTYNKSWWQSFLSGLGFRTDYDRWLEEAQVNANEYDAQVASIKQQNEYNSPAQEAQRMRQAGLNPDLTGIQGVAESASPIQDPQGMTPGQSESGEFGEVTQKIWNFGTSILSLYQVGVGLARDMLSFKQMRNAVDEQDIDLGKQFMTFASDFIQQNSPATPFSNDQDYLDHVESVSDKLRGFPKMMHFNRRQRRIWNSAIGRDFFNSEDFKKMTSSWLQIAENTDKLSKTPQRFRGTFGENDEFATFNVVSKNLGKLADDVWKMTQENQKKVLEAGDAKAKYDKDFYNQLDASKQAGLQNADADLGISTAKIEKAMNSTMERICSDLERQANDGDLLSAGLLLAFQIFRMSNFKVGSKNFSASF